LVRVSWRIGGCTSSGRSGGIPLDNQHGGGIPGTRTVLGVSLLFFFLSLGLLCPLVQADHQESISSHHRTVRSDNSTDVEVGSTWILHVYVSDRVSHAPVEGAEISVEFQDGDVLDLRTDRRGYAAQGIQADLPAVVVLQVGADGYRTETYRVQVLGNLSYAAPLTPISTSTLVDGPSSPYLVLGILVGAVAAWIGVSYARRKRRKSIKTGRRWTR